MGYLHSGASEGCDGFANYRRATGVPVRLLPYLADWDPLSPDNLAQLFAGSRPFHKWSLRSFRLNANGSYPPMRSKSWVDIAIDLDELQLELECQPHPVWCQRAVEALPAVLFVLLDDLKTEIDPNAVAQTAAALPLANPQHTSSRRKDGVCGTLTHDRQLLPPSPSSLAREWQLLPPSSRRATQRLREPVNLGL